MFLLFSGGGFREGSGRPSSPRISTPANPKGPHLYYFEIPIFLDPKAASVVLYRVPDPKGGGSFLRGVLT